MKLMTGIIITGLCVVLFLPGCKKTKHTVETLPETERDYSRYRVIVDVAVIRQGAGRDTGIIGKVKAGELVLISGSTEKREVIGGRDGVWMKAYVGGKDGFVFGGLIRPETDMFNPPYKSDAELEDKCFIIAFPATSHAVEIKFYHDNVVEYISSDDTYTTVDSGRYQVYGNVVFINYDKEKTTYFDPIEGAKEPYENIYSGTAILRLERMDDPDSGLVVAVTNEDGENRMQSR